MRILVLNNGYRRRDDRTRIDFIKKLSRHPSIELFIYGPREELIERELAPVPYDSCMTETDIISYFDPDVLFFILHNMIALDWIPKDICKYNVPSVILEEDHYGLNYQGVVHDDKAILNLYKEFEFSLLLRRHYYNEKAPIQSVWLPFSANEEEFKPTYLTGRYNTVGFAGSVTNHPYYAVRRKAIEVLKESGLLAENHGSVYKGYDKYLQAYIAYLTCGGGMLHTALAKTFEIPACGAVMLTNQLYNSDLLFGDKQCYVTYKDDCSDIVEKAKEILNDHDMAQEIAKNGIEQVYKKHMDKHRLVELYNILVALTYGKEIPRIWGQ